MDKSHFNKVLSIAKLLYKDKDPWENSSNYDIYDYPIPHPLISIVGNHDFLTALLFQNKETFDDWGNMEDKDIIIPKLKKYKIRTEFSGTEVVRRTYQDEVEAYDEYDLKNALNNCDPCYDEGEEVDVDWLDREGDWNIIDMEQISEDVNRIKNMMNVISESKMSEINLESYKKKAIEQGNNEWVEILDRFPDEFQREIIDERPEGSKSDINLIKNWELDPNYPITMNLLNLLQTDSVKESIGRTPRHVMEMIKTNPKYRLELEDVQHISDTEIGSKFGLKSGEIFDQNPERYEEYINYDPKTAEPSTMVNGELYWGVGRLIAALLRGDMTLKVWSVMDNRGV